MITRAVDPQDAVEASAQIRAGDLDPTRLLEDCLARIAEFDHDLGAFTWISPTAREEAAALAGELAGGRWRGPLHGVPVGVKELFDVRGAPRTAGSLALSGEPAESDSPLVARIREAGGVVVGLTRSHEFAWGITTQHARRGSTANPWDVARIPGGSSGGAAAAVASGMVPICLGTDTAGSVRIPAAFCGVVGFKPSPGVLSLKGCIPLAPSFDTAGVIASTVDGVRLFLDALGTRDENTIGDLDRTLTGHDGVDGLVVGLSPALIEFDRATERLMTYRSLLAQLEAAGAHLVELHVPTSADLRRAFAIVQAREAYAFHTRILGTYPSQRERYGDDVAGRLDAAARLDESDEAEARSTLADCRRQFLGEMGRVDVLVTPIITVAPPLRTDPDVVDAVGPRASLREAVMGFTVPQNAYGLPAAVIPWSTASDGLPMSIQVSAGPGKDLRCLSVARQLAQLPADHATSFRADR